MDKATLLLFQININSESKIHAIISTNHFKLHKSMTTQITKVPLIKPDMPSFEEIEKPFREILENGKITNFGKYVTAFEEAAANYLGTHVVTVSSGTMGLIFSLQALGLKPGQKVILPSFTFMATAQAILYAGGIPVFAEIEDDLTLSPNDLEYLLAKHDNVAMVIPVHIYGLPCQTDKIQSIVDAASKQKSQPISIIYDAAHAFGSAINNVKVGNFGNAEVFSLSVTKVVVSVEGGMISSKNPDFIQRIRKMRNYGIDSNYDAYWAGLNGKMSEFHGIIGLENIKKLDSLLEQRQIKARYYLDAINTRTKFNNLPWHNGVIHTFKDLTILMPESVANKRDDVINFLKGKGIETRAYFYPPVHKQHFFTQFSDRPFTKTEQLANRVITLPFYSTITTAEIDYVVDGLAEAEKSLLL